MSSCDSIIRDFKDQNYETIKSMHDENNLFEDPMFLADESSLYLNRSIPYGIRWMRPREMMDNAEFVVDGFERCDMDQGYIGNCWFIAGCVGIMQNKKLFAKVVPEEQSLTENYAGIFHFRFWLYGEWVDVVVDDRLPFWPDGRLLFCSNKQEPNEFWGPLLEKAYAKLYGSYENLDAGQTYDALIDMSGGIQESFDMASMNSTESEKFWRTLLLSFEQESMISCSINPDPHVTEARLTNGLVKGHAYTVTKLTTLDTRYDNIQLIRIRNPWGNEVEWNGAWSDNSREWNHVRDNELEKIDLIREADGEFWMSFDDFKRNFDVVQICHLSASSYSDELTEKKLVTDHDWKCTTYHSKWKIGITSGGYGYPDPAKYWINPQFLVKVVDYGHYEEDDSCCILIALMQKDSRLKRSHKGGESAEEFIQFRVFKINEDVEIDETKHTGLRLYSSQLQKIGSSGSYINSREVTKRFKVKSGNYLITLVVPSTYEENRECEFMLRIFTEQPIDTNMQSLDNFKDDLEEEDTYIEPGVENIKKFYKSILNPKLYKKKLSEWAKSSHFNVDYEKNQVSFGNDRLAFNLASSNAAKSIGAKIGKYNFDIDYKGGFKFRHSKNDE